jgi:hypothetical protein
VLLGRWIVGQTTNYTVRVTLRGRSGRRFGWEIRTDNSLVVERSSSTFSTQARALLASAKAASCLAFPLTVSPFNPLQRVGPTGKSERAFVENEARGGSY